MARFVPIVIQVSEGTSKQTVTQLTNAFKQLDSEVKDTGRSASGLSFSSLTGAITLGGLASNVFSRLSDILINGARSVLDYSSNLENTKIAFTTMLGSADLAAEHLKDLQAFALKTPFQFQELVSASQRMQALGFSAQQVLPILEDVGNAVAAAGGGSERLDRVVLALSQIQSKGHVATQELNQLAESGISGFKILEAQLGKSRGEIAKMVEEGEISSAVFLEAFQKFSKQNFGGLMEAQSKTFAGAMSNIKDALLQTSATAFEPLYKKLSETAQRLGDTSTKSKEFKDDMTAVGNQLATAWDGIIEAIHVVEDAVGLVSAGIVSALSLLTHGLFGLIDTIRATGNEFQALAALARGDVSGAIIHQNEATRRLQRAHEELGQALGDQFIVWHKAMDIWTQAGNRAAISSAQIAEAAATIAVDNPSLNINKSAVGAGIFRAKSSIEDATGDSTKGTKRDAGLELLKQLQGQYDGLIAKTELEKVNLQLLDKEYANINPKVAEQVRLIASLITNLKAKDDVDKELEKTQEQNSRLLKDVTSEIIRQENEISDLVTGLPDWKRATLDFIEAKKQEGFVWADNTEKMFLARAGYLAVLKSMADVREEQSRAAADLAEQMRKDEADRVEKAAKAMQDRADAFYDQMSRVAGDVTNVIDRSISDGFERGIGAGVKSFLAGIGQMLRNSLLDALQKRLTDIFTGRGASGSAGPAFGGSGAGGGIGGIIGNIFGGGGGGLSPLTGGFAGGPGAAQLLGGALGGGITAPPALSASPGSLAQLLTGGVASGVGGSSAAAGGSGGLAGILGSGAALALPFLGAGLGASLGGGSPLGTILGGVGGGLLGLVGIAAAPTSIGGLGAGLAGLSALGLAAAGIGAAAVVAAIIISKNKARQRDEKTRNGISNETGTAIWALIDQARSLGTAQSLARWNEIKNNYFTQIAQIKDGKTRRNAELQWQNDFSPLLEIVKTRSKEGDAAKELSSSFIPTFASGGLVPYFGGMQTMIKVRPGERIDDVGMMRSWTVPGVDRGYDSILTAATPGSAVRTRAQQSRIPGFAGGSNAPLSGGGGTIVFQVTNDATAALLQHIFRGMKMPAGKRVIVEASRENIRKERMEGMAGDLVMTIGNPA